MVEGKTIYSAVDGLGRPLLLLQMVWEVGGGGGGGSLGETIYGINSVML